MARALSGVDGREQVELGQYTNTGSSKFGRLCWWFVCSVWALCCGPRTENKFRTSSPEPSQNPAPLGLANANTAIP